MRSSGWIHCLSLLRCSLLRLNGERWANEAMGIGCRIRGWMERELCLLCLWWLATLPCRITAKLRCSGAMLDASWANDRWATLPRSIAAKLWRGCAMLYTSRTHIGLCRKLLGWSCCTCKILCLRWCGQTTTYAAHATMKYRCLVLEYGRIERHVCIALALQATLRLIMRDLAYNRAGDMLANWPSQRLWEALLWLGEMADGRRCLGKTLWWLRHVADDR